MSAPPERPSFRQIYRQQYRSQSANPTARVMRVVAPVALLAAALFLRHSAVVSIPLGILAVLLIATAIILSRRQRHSDAVQPEQQSQSRRETGAGAA